MNYWVISFYDLALKGDPIERVKKLKSYFQEKDIKGRIYLSDEGINAQMSAPENQAKIFLDWVQKELGVNPVHFNIQHSNEHAFYKMAVKYRKQLVAFDQRVDFSSRGKHLSPEKWKEVLEEKDQDTIVIDARNGYESTVGHFEGALLPKCETFREFPDYAKQLKQTFDPKKTRVLMYCTGGIRCEYLSAFMKEEGFEKVFQLEGGVIHYGEKEGLSHWKGKLFVFDDRLTSSISCSCNEPISSCSHCETKSDTYYNCANMDCNALFLSCPSCVEKHKGCCGEKCRQAKRVRPFKQEEVPKPFRRLSHKEKQELFG